MKKEASLNLTPPTMHRIDRIRKATKDPKKAIMPSM
jgi:hypothetical protein